MSLSESWISLFLIFAIVLERSNELSFNCLFRLDALISTFASIKNFTSALGIIIVPISLPSIMEPFPWEGYSQSFFEN